MPPTSNCKPGTMVEIGSVKRDFPKPELMSSLTGLPGLDQMKVDSQSPEEAVQLVGSVPLSPAKEALQTDSQPGRAGVFPQAERPSPEDRHQKPAERAERLGAATCGDTKAALSASWWGAG